MNVPLLSRKWDKCSPGTVRISPVPPVCLYRRQHRRVASHPILTRHLRASTKAGTFSGLVPLMLMTDIHHRLMSLCQQPLSQQLLLCVWWTSVVGVFTRLKGIHGMLGVKDCTPTCCGAKCTSRKIYERQSK